MRQIFSAGIFRLTLCVLSLTTASCGPVRSDRASLCGEIARFANTTVPGETQEIVFRTTWGPTEEVPGTLASKRCEHNNVTAAMTLCDYLVSNSSTEFAEYNFANVLACMNGEKQRPPRRVSIERMETLIWASEVPGVREDVSVGVEFVMSPDRAPMLRIMAEASQ